MLQLRRCFGIANSLKKIIESSLPLYFLFCKFSKSKFQLNLEKLQIHESVHVKKFNWHQINLIRWIKLSFSLKLDAWDCRFIYFSNTSHTHSSRSFMSSISLHHWYFIQKGLYVTFYILFGYFYNVNHICRHYFRYLNDCFKPPIAGFFSK